MRLLAGFFKWILLLLGGGFLAALIFGAGVVMYFLPELPDVEELRQVHYQVPLRVLATDGSLIAEFGEKRRIPLAIGEIPEHLKQAVISAEDDRFYEHPGVDYQGILRAAINLATTGTRTQGGSTITMQVARNFFLDRERTYTRKLREILLALKIEKALSKDEILALYLNRNYMGNRAYGVGAAAYLYYGKSVDELSLAEIAMLAGLYKAPSKYNPLANAERSRLRRNYVLRRMHEQGYISTTEMEAAQQAPVTATLHGPKIDLEAHYVAEMVRSYLYKQYGDELYGLGLTVKTTIAPALQVAAEKALSGEILAYDRRHGYRGPEAHHVLPRGLETEALDAILAGYKAYSGLRPALVVSTEMPNATLYLGKGKWVDLPFEGVKWARAYVDENTRGKKLKSFSSVFKPGDIVRVIQKESKWELSQLPKVGGALVSISPEDGRILALQGGFDYFYSRFNRVTQAARQPGSNFKPFVYSSALAKGFTPASTFNDAPVVFYDENLGRDWRPENYSQKFYGPTRMRVALANSRNLVSIRLLRKVGIRSAIRHIEKFEMTNRPYPKNLSLSLGTGELTPIELVSGYAVFANGGYRVEPYFISSIQDATGKTIYEHKAATVCKGECPGVVKAEQVIDPRNAYQMVSMMRDVIARGTGRRARALKRSYIAGKTGTTNEQRDAWFSGFTRDIVTTVWMGFDEPRPLGKRETGGKLALPPWIEYMKVALEGKKDRPWEKPEGMVTVKIDPETGLRARPGNQKAVLETFRREFVPDEESAVASSTGEVQVPEQLF
ncbi:MAG: penicillin-binding protein 1A [bacterium]